MAWLPHGEKISKISFFVLAQLTNVTDRRTNTETPHAGNSRAMHSIARQKLYDCLLNVSVHGFMAPSFDWLVACSPVLFS